MAALVQRIRCSIVRSSCALRVCAQRALFVGVQRKAMHTKQYNPVRNSNTLLPVNVNGCFRRNLCTEVNLKGRVFKIVMEQLGVYEGKVKLDSKFVDDLGADSLDLVEIILALEEEFECEISDSDAEKIKTPRDAMNYIENKVFV